MMFVPDVVLVGAVLSLMAFASNIEPYYYLQSQSNSLPTKTTIHKRNFHCTHAFFWTLSLMALEWVLLGYAAGAEAIMVLLLTLPGLDPLRKGLITVTRSLLKPFLSVVPFCLFLLMDIYWKYETRPSCEAESCSPSEHLRHQKSIMKSQRNALLIASALIFYWLLYSVTGLVVKVDQLNKRLEKLKSQD
ncbi:unnamed protein product [Ilex paraguariensis]|uniref:Endoplasmic reticulum transmembrane protein n=1 Tax=Ilex paraguariensis TaxID=185542 RepID=A0ABC8SGR8_9AQUA